LLAEDKKKYNAQNKGIFAKNLDILIIDGFGAVRWFRGGLLRFNTNALALVEE